MKLKKLSTTRFFPAPFLLCSLIKNLLFFSKEIRAQTVIVKLILAAILIVTAIIQVNAQSGHSTTAIDIKEFSFTPSTIDTTNSSQTITVTVRVTNTERDFWNMYVVFKSPRISYQYGLSIQDRISGDGRDGVYRKSFTFHQYAEAGTWEVSYIHVYDGTTSNYRWRQLNTSELAARGFATQLQVINNNEAVPPEISDFSFTPSAINTTNGSQNVAITLRAKDETSGVSSIFVSFSNPPDCYYYDDDCLRFDFPLTSANRISGDSKDGVYKVVVTFPQNSTLATYSVSITAMDAVRNFKFLNPAELAARGYPAQLQITSEVSSARKTPFDFDGDGRADLSVFRSSNRFWYINRTQGGFDAVHFGLATDKLTPADFDGDGRTDIAVFRDGFWYWLNSSNGAFNAFQFGTALDVPVPADFTGDGRAELAVYRAGVWYTLDLANNGLNAFHFGNVTDKPVIGDYDGDSKADYAVFRPSDATWYYQQSTIGFGAIQFGLSTDKPVPADYDGDSKTDVAVFRPLEGYWYVKRSTSNTLQAVNWGLGADALVPADYDGDGKADVAVYRNGVWYIRQTTGAVNYAYFGLGSDVPTNQVQ